MRFTAAGNADRKPFLTVGKPKSATSKRDIPLNDTAIEMIKDLRKEYCFGEDSPLITDEHGEVTRPVNFRKRFYRILKAAGIEAKGLHSLRHTFATRLINGTKDKNGNIKSLTPKTSSQSPRPHYLGNLRVVLNGVLQSLGLPESEMPSGFVCYWSSWNVY